MRRRSRSNPSIPWAEDDNAGHGPRRTLGLRGVPEAAAPPRPDVLLGHAAAAGGRPAGHPRALRLRANGGRDRRRPAPPAHPGRAPCRARRLGDRAARGDARGALRPAGGRGAGRRRPPARAAARGARPVHALDAGRLRPGAHRGLGGARDLHGRLGRLGRADHGHAARAARAPPGGLRAARPGVPADQLRARRARGRRARPRLPAGRRRARARARGGGRARGPRACAVRRRRAGRPGGARLRALGHPAGLRGVRPGARPRRGRRLRRSLAPGRPAALGLAARAGRSPMTRRATLRGEERTPLDARADVLICGASFAGLAVARELAGAGADVLVVDRYEIGERATSACAAPTPWLHAMGVERSIRQEIPCMAFHTPYGSARFRLPWSWSSFDYRELCHALWEQCDARFEVAKVEGRRVSPSDPRKLGSPGDVTIHTDRGDLTAPLLVDALGWRRVLGTGPNVQPPDALISRGLEVHPHDARGVDLEVWI